MPSWTIRSAARSLTDPPGLNPSNLAKIRTLAGSPAGSFRSSIKGVSPIRSRMDSALLGSADGTETNRRLGVARAIVALCKKLAAPGNGRDDRNIIALF
jgi:hypothetical protein